MQSVPTFNPCDLGSTVKLVTHITVPGVSQLDNTSTPVSMPAIVTNAGTAIAEWQLALPVGTTCSFNPQASA